MTKVEKIEQDIRKLDQNELLAFRRWFREYDSDAWDRQIEEDVRAGKLDKLAEEALAGTSSGEQQRDLKHFASPNFWVCYRALPEPIQELANKNFELLKANPSHRSLRFKKVGKYRAVRVGLYYRALATEVGDDLLWFWIGPHSEYDKLVS